MESPKNIKIALVSATFSAYSETFIQAQKERLSGEVFYYYGGSVPTHLENSGPLLTLGKKIIYKAKKEVGLSDFSIHERAFLNSLRQNKINVVLAQYGPTAHRILKVCRYLDIPLVTHFHGYDASVRTVIDKFDSYKEVFTYSSRVIAVSKKMKEMLIAMGCPEEKLVHSPCGPNPYFESIDSSYSKKQFLAIGRFTDKKAPYYTILAFKDILEKHPDARLLMAGHGELMNTCQNLIKFYGLEKSVDLLGVITAERLGELMQESMAFVQHSVTAANGDMEGTPVSVMEASLAGLPVISTFHAGIPDVVLHEKTGFLVQEHDVAGMTDYMLKVLSDKQLAKAMGHAGRNYILSNYSMDIHIKKIDQVIASCFK